MDNPRIVWHSPAPVRPRDGSPALKRLDEFSVAIDLPLALAATSLREAGVPSVDGARTPKEDVTGLLMLAAEVEHALMAQYLYAALSIRGAAARQLNHVAVQEMGHLVTVQNLLLAISGITAEGIPSVLHLGRDRLRRASSRNPLPLILEPVSRSALGKFVVVERPYEITDAALSLRVNMLERDVATQGVSVHPVYALYAAIRWIFQADDGDGGGLSAELGLKPGWHLSDGDFVDATTLRSRSAEPVEWHSVPDLIVLPVTDRSEALIALDAIAAQGEGLPGTFNSHFAAFLSLLDQFEEGGVGVKPLPVDPATAGQAPPESGSPTIIDHPYTVLWARLFDTAYEILLLDIAWALAQPRGEVRSGMIDLCINAMSKVIQPLASDLCGRPLRGAGPEKAAPPFALSSEDVPDTLAGFEERFDTCLARQAAIRAELFASPEFATDPFARLRFAAIDSIDAARRPTLPRGD